MCHYLFLKKKKNDCTIWMQNQNMIHNRAYFYLVEMTKWKFFLSYNILERSLVIYKCKINEYILFSYFHKLYWAKWKCGFAWLSFAFLIFCWIQMLLTCMQIINYGECMQLRMNNSKNYLHFVINLICIILIFGQKTFI